MRRQAGKLGRFFCSCCYVLVFLLFITSLFHYSLEYGGDFTMGDFLENRHKYAGHKKNIIGPYGGQAEGGFFVVINKVPVKINYDKPSQPPKYGDVLVYGTLEKDGSITALGVHNYDYAYFSTYGTSLVAGLLVLFLFLREWKITRRGIKNA